MTEMTARLALPLLAAGQAQKEITHNEALLLADALLQAVVQGAPQNTPPANPQAGQCWIVGAAPSGAWAGRASNLAYYGAGGWRFSAPFEGLSVIDGSTGVTRRYRQGAWQQGEIDATALRIAGNQVVGARQPAIGSAAGGTVIDTQARTAIDAVLAALRSHGLIAP